jgi:FlaA1/EpsC-like NDP-sugar epimerase
LTGQKDLVARELNVRLAVEDAPMEIEKQKKEVFQYLLRRRNIMLATGQGSIGPKICQYLLKMSPKNKPKRG